MAINLTDFYMEFTEEYFDRFLDELEEDTKILRRQFILYKKEAVVL